MIRDVLLRPSKERLLHLLAEAAELEHNLLCSYLFALFGLKEDESEGLTRAELEAVKQWRKDLLGVCVEEMTHFAQIANITVAIGGRIHINRPNIPVAAGYHPAAVVVELSRLDLDTLTHFAFLERPDGHPMQDGASFAIQAAYVRRQHYGSLMPSSPEYTTIGEFYSVIKQELEAYAAAFGEHVLFSGPRGTQLQARELHTDTLRVVENLADAQSAIDEIVAEGEGSSAESETSHFAMFSRMRSQYVDLQRRRPEFDPSRAVGRNPVMHAPVSSERTHVNCADASRVLDAANAAYGFMLRCLAQCFETSRDDEALRGRLLSGCVGAMKATSTLGRSLTRMQATDEASTKAGISFAMLRSTSGWQRREDLLAGLHERATEITQVISGLPIDQAAISGACEALASWARADSFAAAVAGGGVSRTGRA